MVIQKKNHQHHTHLRGASFLGFIMFWTFSFSYFTALKYVINILMNQKWTYLSRRRQLYQELASYYGRLNLVLSSQTFQRKVRTWVRLCSSSNHNRLLYMTNITQ